MLGLFRISLKVDNAAIITQPGQNYLNIVDVPHCFSETCWTGGVGDECPSLGLGKDEDGGCNDGDLSTMID